MDRALAASKSARPGEPARLAAVAAVVRHLGVVLGQGQPRLGDDTFTGRIVASQELHRVVPRTQVHVVDGRLEDALGIARQMAPERIVGGAELHGLVAQDGERWVFASPVGETRLGFFEAAEAPQQDDLERPGAHASRPQPEGGPNPAERAFVVSGHRQQPGQLEKGRGARPLVAQGALEVAARPPPSPRRVQARPRVYSTSASFVTRASARSRLAVASS